jgi:hypothetical protein
LRWISSRPSRVVEENESVSIIRRAVVFFLLLCSGLVAAAQDASGLEVLARVHLREIQKGAAVAGAYMGAGITVRVKRASSELPMVEVLTVAAGGTKLFEAEDGVYETAALYRFEGAYHLVIAEYTGGAHCCGQYSVFSRAAGASTWRLVGVSGAENGGPMPAWEVLVPRGDRLYLREWDNRFDYFHACHACSLLGNIGPQYSLISPGGLEPADEAFQDVYAKLAAAADAEIAAEARRRTATPRAILDQSADPSQASFTDDLGQMLVKRTIFLVRAGEEEKAWQAFAADITRYYQTTDGTEPLKTEIIELLRQ